MLPRWMTREVIKDLRDAVPFRPFTIRTADGQGFQVPNQVSLLFAEEGRTVILVTADQRFHILATSLITGIDR